MNILTWNELNETEKQTCLRRPSVARQEMEESVRAIIEAVRKNGDVAIKQFTKQFDKVELSELSVNRKEITDAYAMVEQDTLEAMNLAISRIRDFHELQISETVSYEKDGVTCLQLRKPIQSVGLYVPGGSAPLISTVMMLAVPAAVAGCPNKIICTPANAEGQINPNILVASDLCGIDKIYKIGGAQAIAAMAFGTETVVKANKIFGPGNAWVTLAKQICSETAEGASQDLPAGPSEVMVIADATANAEFVAWDLLSQAEHGVDSQVVLLSTERDLLEKVSEIIGKSITSLSRKNIIEGALKNSRLVLVKDIKQAIEISNQYAPEHLILQIAESEKYLNQIDAAGSVFLGPWTPESLGDYITGSNHVLPTYGYAKSYSGLSLKDFMLTISVQRASESGLMTVGPSAERLAKLEGLQAHAQAIAVRRKSLAGDNHE